MEVSNSTGRDTDYRVGAGGGTQASIKPAAAGCLAAGTRTHLKLDSTFPWLVEFLMDGSVVASGVINKAAAKVALAQGPQGYILDISPKPR